MAANTKISDTVRLSDELGLSGELHRGTSALHCQAEKYHTFLNEVLYEIKGTTNYAGLLLVPVNSFGACRLMALLAKHIFLLILDLETLTNLRNL